MNHPLTRALSAAGLSVVDVAAQLGVDPKTVARWLAGRTPFPRHRAALVALTGWTERDLWPDLKRSTVPEAAAHEVSGAYPYRSAVPADAWHRLFASAEHEISILAYSALFLVEDPVILRTLREKARAGVRVRVAFGDPDGQHVASRGAEEGIGRLMVTRVHNAIVLLAPLIAERAAELRLHDTVLYNSIYRADDDLLVNAHAYGCHASQAPVLHLHRNRDDGMATKYIESFERIWGGARHA